ncbi:molybdenum cofactor guanylyltransferase [Sphingomonas sp. ID0503]|uniref:molybdenum cofactor guanylyltransferase n=1 Tax=Sphingomonas sp. ID0503 TaxID=3399691 RepID=UPI003AFB437F
MPVLGAVLAGGRSTRFGSDKALAVLDGKPLIEHAIAALRAHCETVVICGRSWQGFETLEDRPAGGCGPLAGLNAALALARERQFDSVLSVPIDTHPLSGALSRIRHLGCAVSETQWTIGIWPSDLGQVLDRHLADGRRSLRSWIDVAQPTLVPDGDLELRNFNLASDLLDRMPVTDDGSMKIARSL